MFEDLISAFGWVSQQIGLATVFINELSGGNDFLAAAIFGAIATGAGWGALVFTKGIPGFFRRRFVVTITADNDGSHSSCNFYELKNILKKYRSRFGTRAFFINRGRFHLGSGLRAGLRLSPGLGKHWFFYKKKLYWYSIVDLQSSGSEKQKKRVTLSTFGFDSSKLQAFLEDHSEEIKTGIVGVNTHSPNGDAQFLANARFPSLDELAVNPSVRDYFTDLCVNFEDNLKQARANGTNYRYIGTIHGEPGSGKSSLICSVARTIGAEEVYNITLEDFKDTDSLRKLIMQNIPCQWQRKPAIFIIEDAHSYEPLLKKELQSPEISIAENGVTLSGLLNVFNGIIPLDNVMIFITTNYINNLDPALVRPGRCNAVIELPRIHPDVANKWIGERVEGYEPIINEPIRGCDLDQIVSGSGYDKDIIERNAAAVLEKLPVHEKHHYDDTNKVILE